MALNYGSRFLDGHRPDHSAYLVRRLREAGFVIVGVTNLPEFGILPTTEPRHTGAHPQPVGPRAHARRIERRLGGRGRVRDAAARARQRRRRLDPDSGRLLRPGGAQAEPRARVARARPRRLVAGLRRRADAHRGRHRARARRARRLRGRRRQLGAAADRALRGLDAARPRAPADRGDGREPVRRRRRPRRDRRAAGRRRAAGGARARRRRGVARVAAAGRARDLHQRLRAGDRARDQLRRAAQRAASRARTRSSRCRGCCSSARGRRRRSAT